MVEIPLAHEQGRADFARLQRRWKARQDRFDPRRLVFVHGERLQRHRFECNGDLDPDEQVFTKIKQAMRRAQRRETDDTYEQPGKLIGIVTTDECANYFTKARYTFI